MSAPDGVLPAAADWLQGVLLGSAGTAIAVLAVAGVGFSLMQGRLSPREGIRVVLGCFILFGAAAIARELAELAYGAGGTPLAPASSPAPPPIEVPLPQPVNPDPYAGASVPM